MSKSTISQAQQQFVNDREDYTEKQIELSQLYYLTLINSKLENNRKNTANTVWLLFIPFMIGGFILLAMLITGK